jgi:hypothetical protein
MHFLLFMSLYFFRFIDRIVNGETGEVTMKTNVREIKIDHGVLTETTHKKEQSTVKET